MKANNSLRLNMPRALELISFFFLGHGPTYPISDLSGSAITRGTVLFLMIDVEFLIDEENLTKSTQAKKKGRC